MLFVPRPAQALEVLYLFCSVITLLLRLMRSAKREAICAGAEERKRCLRDALRAMFRSPRRRATPRRPAFVLPREARLPAPVACVRHSKMAVESAYSSRAMPLSDALIAIWQFRCPLIRVSVTLFSVDCTFR